jgi:mRNA interferase MazF
VRGDVHGLRAPRGTRGSEQRGKRYAVVLQSDELPLSTVLVAPTSRSALPASFRPVIEFGDDQTRVLVEQMVAVAPERLGELVGHVSRLELEAIDDAIKDMFSLD